MAMAKQVDFGFGDDKTLDSPRAHTRHKTSRLAKNLLRAALLLALTLFISRSLPSSWQQVSRFLCKEASLNYQPFPHPVHADSPPVDPKSRSPVARWRPCPDHEDEGFECSYVRVPKDHHNESIGFAYIAVSRLRATARAHEQLGAIYLNPGGPGGSGVRFSYTFAPILHNLTRGRYDIIGFDPRGIGATRPLVDCFGSTKAYELFKAGTPLERPFDVAPDPFSKQGQEVLLRQWTETQALKQIEMEKCTEQMGDELLYMGTTTVVRDISFLNFEAGLGRGRPINFMGFSYGTILGAYLANMLPSSSLNHIVIDGVSGAPSWSSKTPEQWIHGGWLADTEKAWRWLLKECSQTGPDGCALARKQHENPDEIEKRLMTWLDELYYQPLTVSSGPRPGVLTSGIARAMVYRATNLPAAWPKISSFVAEAMAGNGTQLYYLGIHPITEDPQQFSQPELSRAAVGCGDAPPFDDPKFGNLTRPTPELLVNLTLKSIKQWSPHFAASAPSVEVDGGCQWHPALGRTPERYHGPWNNTLRLPMLVVSNTADPITPLSYGKEIHEIMGTSTALLTMNAPGHTTLGAVSACTFHVLQKYLLDDKMPEEGTICERDEDDFSLDSAVLSSHDSTQDDAKALRELSRESVLRFRRYVFPSLF